MTAPDPVQQPSICCMCGDRGLPGELFQCAICLHRLQHRYCSDQYPRVAAYSICNWCVRDKEVGGGSRSPSPAAAKAVTARAKQRAASSSRLNASRAHHDDKDRPCSGGSGGCSRSAFPAEPLKPVKKPKKSHEKAARAAAAAAKGTEGQTGGARKKPQFRAKARVPRYKLLTEVIRCK